jgi:succinate-semialdehyde dehydrogenase/glutarate-semialdehyde dehydrogenase
VTAIDPHGASAIASPPPRAPESRDPATGELWRRFEPTDAAGVHAAVARAREAQREWAARPVHERARVLERFRRALYARREEVATTIHRETGKPLVEALAAEVAIVLDFARFYARVAPRELADRRLRITAPAFWRKRVTLVHEPLGVVGVISPWNYPFMLAAGHVLPALVAGNAAVLKPSQQTTGSGLALVELLHEAGVPTAVVQLVPGTGGTGAALTSSTCDKIFFTGSEAVGRTVARGCAERLVPCVLELGGSDPAIVLEDADVAVAAAGITWGRFFNAGQSCVAPKRVFVVDAVYDRFLQALATELRHLRTGPTGSGAEVGPLISASQRELLLAQLEDALTRGARVAAQGPLPSERAERFVPPTLLVDVTPEMRVLHEETFGPLLPVVRVRDADEAVARANDSTFGLSASVWGRDLARATAVARRVQSGTVLVNDVLAIAGMADVPYGGVKASGTGRSHGVEGLHECVRTRAIVVDRLPGLRQPWWFGYSDALRRGIDAYISLVHGDGAGQRLGHAGALRHLLARMRG